MKAEYKLKPGAIVIRIKNGADYFNRFSITDEKAEIALTESKGLIKYFEQFPQDWLVRCGHAKAVSIDTSPIKTESTIDTSMENTIEKQIEEMEQENEPVEKKKRGRKAKI